MSEGMSIESEVSGEGMSSVMWMPSCTMGDCKGRSPSPRPVVAMLIDSLPSPTYIHT